jgi:uncharacterized cupredoxin-like copper-binding protein
MKRLGTILTLTFILCWPVHLRADEKPPAENLHRVTVSLNEYRYSPNRIDLKIGEPTELVLVNEGTVLHEFVTQALTDVQTDVEIEGVIVEALGIGEVEIPPKSTAVLRFTPRKAGQFSFTCGAEKPKSHLKQGMAGLLVFE